MEGIGKSAGEALAQSARSLSDILMSSAKELSHMGPTATREAYLDLSVVSDGPLFRRSQGVPCHLALEVGGAFRSKHRDKPGLGRSRYRQTGEDHQAVSA